MASDEAPAWGTLRPSLFPKLAIAAARLKLIRGGIRDRILRISAKIDPTIDCELDGLRVRAHYSDNMTERGIATHRIDADTNVIEKIVADLKPGDIFVDVGANIGWISLNAARQVGPAGRVIAIEPIAELRRRMAFNAASNGFDNITIVGSAVGDETGETRFHVNPSQQGMSSIAAQDGYQTIRVPVTTLAEIIRKAGISRIDAIKMDAEGHEDRIILPLIKSEPKSLWPKKIFLEIRHADRWKTDCISSLTGAGYKRVWFDHSDALMKLDPQPSSD